VESEWVEISMRRRAIKGVKRANNGNGRRMLRIPSAERTEERARRPKGRFEISSIGGKRAFKKKADEAQGRMQN